MASGLVFGLLLLGAGCARPPEAPVPLFVYCTTGVQPYASLLTGLLRDQPEGAPTVAPLRDDDLLAALQGLHAGDLVVCPEGSLPALLEKAGLVSRQYAVGSLRLVALAKRPGLATFEDLCQPGVRVGCGQPKAPMGAQAQRCAPGPQCERLAANVIHRSEVPAELLRLLAHDGLDAALVWDPGKRPAGLTEVRLPGPADAKPCRLLALELTCSRRTPADLDRVRAAWTDPAAQPALRAGGLDPAPAGGGAP